MSPPRVVRVWQCIAGTRGTMLRRKPAGRGSMGRSAASALRPNSLQFELPCC
jgi:hypothetical protein